MDYSDCDAELVSTPESRLAAALEADVARHLAEVRAEFFTARFEMLRNFFMLDLVNFAFQRDYYADRTLGRRQS